MNTWSKMILSTLAFTMFVGCQTDKTEKTTDVATAQTVTQASTPSTKETNPGAATPTEDVAQTLSFLVQEEKLAYDVYHTLGQTWPHRTFKNIQRSEQRHMNAIAALLTARDLDNPNDALEPGKFKDHELQTLYDRLITQGEPSLADALHVGALIEEQDIKDLTDHITTSKDQEITTVLTRLRRASYNHLDGFTSAWEKETGKTYTPQLLKDDVYQEARAAGAAHHAKHRGSQGEGGGCEGEGQGHHGEGGGCGGNCQHE